MITTSELKTADGIKVGDIIEFEIGSPVKVLTIEDNWDGHDGIPMFEPHPYLAKDLGYGRSLIFTCAFPDSDDVYTWYIRREKSPISGRGYHENGVVR